MKKMMIIGFMAILIGIVFGKIMFEQYDKELVEVLKGTEVIYILQQGVYSTLDSVDKNTAHLASYIVVEDEEYYRVYVGMTKNKENVDKIKGVFVKSGNDIYVREISNDNQAFLEILSQYDNLLESTTGEQQILQIEKQVINKYEELVIRNE